MGQVWQESEPFMRALAYLVDEAKREEIRHLHLHLRTAETEIAKEVLNYLLEPPLDGKPHDVCPETMDAISFIIERMIDLPNEQLKALARYLESELSGNVS